MVLKIVKNYEINCKFIAIKMNPVDDPDAYYAQMRKQIEDQKKKRERDGVKR